MQGMKRINTKDLKIPVNPLHPLHPRKFYFLPKHSVDGFLHQLQTNSHIAERRVAGQIVKHALVGQIVD